MLRFQESLYSIGDVFFSCRTESDALLSSWNSLFCSEWTPILSKSIGDVLLNISVDGCLGTNYGVGKPFCRSKRYNSKVSLEGFCFSGFLSLENNRYLGNFSVVDNSVESLSSLVKCILAYVLSERNHLLLHSSGVVRHGRLWLFVGPAKAGKTTIATELNGGGEPFCVDRAIVALQNGRVVAYPTPMSDHDKIIKKNRPLPLAGIAFIKQSPTACLSEVNSAISIQRLLRHSFLIEGHSEALAPMMESADKIQQLVPVVEMHFARDESFWPLLDDFLVEKPFGDCRNA